MRLLYYFVVGINVYTNDVDCVFLRDIGDKYYSYEFDLKKKFESKIYYLRNTSGIVLDDISYSFLHSKFCHAQVFEVNKFMEE